MSSAPKHRWLQIVVLVMVAIVVAELPFVTLALSSTIPYFAGWASDKDGMTTVKLYWDGRTEIDHPLQKPIWAVAVEIALWLGLACCLSFATLLLAVRLKRRRAMACTQS